MGIVELFSASFVRYCSFFAWRDFVEIGFFAVFFFGLSRWLARDQRRPLARYWYLFMTVWMLAAWLQCFTVVWFFAANVPVLIIFFMLIHHETLQRNMVVPVQVKTAQVDKTSWVDALFPACLYALNQKKELTVLIEHAHALDDYVHCPFRVNCVVSKEVLVTFIESSLFDATKSVWITSTGALNAVNVSIVPPAGLEQSATRWYECVLALTAKTDALVLHVNPGTESFDVVVKDNVAENLSAASALLILNKHVAAGSNLSGDYNYASRTEKTISR